MHVALGIDDLTYNVTSSPSSLLTHKLTPLQREHDDNVNWLDLWIWAVS
jgi:hypothetical protein